MRQYGTIWLKCQPTVYPRTVQGEGWCPGAGRMYHPARGADTSVGAPRPTVRCTVCNRRLVLSDDRNPWFEGEFHHYAVPSHKARVHRAKGPRRKVQRQRRGQ